MKIAQIVLPAGITMLAFAFATPVLADHGWDEKIDNAKARFKVLPDFDKAAVLDNETQLVWEREPNLIPREWSNPFVGAVDNCFKRVVADRARTRATSARSRPASISATRSISPQWRGQR